LDIVTDLQYLLFIIKKFAVKSAAMSDIKLRKKPVEIGYVPSDSERDLLNLVAEIIVQVIIKETESECDRVCADKHERSI